MASSIIPKIVYAHRPAFRLLASTVLGAIIYHSGHLLLGCIILAVIALILIINPYEKLESEVFVWIILFGMVFGLYTNYRATLFTNIKGQTLYDARIKVLYPIITSAESQIRYRAKVQTTGNKWIDVQLDVPQANTIDLENSFGSEGIATLEITPLASINNSSYQRYLISNGIDATATIHYIRYQEPMRHPPLFSLLQGWRYRLKQHFEAISEQHIAWENRGLIYALSLGDRSLLPAEMKRQFANSGVAHILALSGYHLGVVMWMVGVIIGRLIWRYRWRHWRYLITATILIAYTLFSGASIATLRALLMSCIVLGGKLLGRPTDPIQLLSLVMLLFLVLNPFAYYSVGLLLSISAVWGIYSFYDLFQHLLNTGNRVLRWFSDVICMTVSAQIGVLPLLLMHFGTAPLTFIWSNVPLVFISGIMIPLALVCFVIMLIFGGIPTILLNALNILANSMNKVTTLFSTNQLSLELRFDLVSLALYYLIAYLGYRLLHSYACRLEMRRLREKGRE